MGLPIGRKVSWLEAEMSSDNSIACRFRKAILLNWYAVLVNTYCFLFPPATIDLDNMSHFPDENLLFGIFALQLNFVSRSQLVSGMQAWVLEKRTSLGDIYVRQQSMTVEQKQLLEALLKEHLKKNEGDIEKSIQQLSSFDPFATQELLAINDTGLRESLLILKSNPASYDPHSTLPPSILEPRGAGRYRIIRPHRRGGLGEVFVAKDTELSREVALKEIQNRYAYDAESRLRFMREAEITGRLEHPGIVPVYGLGTYDDGRPFYPKGIGRRHRGLLGRRACKGKSRKTDRFDQ